MLSVKNLEVNINLNGVGEERFIIFTDIIYNFP